MNEYSRILIEKYCAANNSSKCRRLKKLVEKSYDMAAAGTDSDAVFLENAIKQEESAELREALEDLNNYIFSY